MASSSSSRSGYRLNGQIIKFRNSNCFCLKRASIRISESSNNPNRLYFKCESGACKFFKFWEPESVDFETVWQNNGCPQDSEMKMEVRSLRGGLEASVQVIQSGMNGMISSIGGLKTLSLLCFVISLLNLLCLIMKK